MRRRFLLLDYLSRLLVASAPGGGWALCDSLCPPSRALLAAAIVAHASRYVSASARPVDQGAATSTELVRLTTMSSVPSVVKIWIMSLSG
jgi:hypothetical protein